MFVNLKIKYKLFFALFLTSLMVAIALVYFLQWNFDRGFLNYVNNQELEQLDLLQKRLIGLYADQGDWSFMVENHELWQQLHGEIRYSHRGKGLNDLASAFPPPPLHGKPRPPQASQMPPPPGGPDRIGPRLMLLDNDKQKIIGGLPARDKRMALHPMHYQSRVIGYLGVIPVKELSDAGDLLFVEQQTVSFILVTGVMILLSLLVSLSITSHLLRPINALIEGTRKLISGWFTTRIPVTTGDELGTLSAHFNNLALTLEENEKARQQWVADISHELRTPLAILQGEVEAMQDGIEATDAQSLESLHSEILHLGRLVNDLYELSMTDIGALNYKKIAVDPIAILMETYELFEQRFHKQGLSVRYLGEENGAPILADPDRLQQLFTNVLENSLRYTSSPGEVEVHAGATNEAIHLTFMDSGPGVTADQLPRVFDRLFRAEKSRSREKGGAGLGMAICKNIVEAHLGIIQADHSPLGGLKVTITLPRTD